MDKNTAYQVISQFKENNCNSEALALVDGYVELIHLDGDNILLCDDDGVLRFKRINTLATSHAKQLGWKGSYLVGSVLFLKDKEF